MALKFIVAIQNETVSHAAWRFYGWRFRDVVEAIYQMDDNKHLSELPAALPAGTKVYLPQNLPSSHPEKPAVNLWD